MQTDRLTKIQKPSKILVPLAEGLAWGNGGEEYIYMEKMDGRFMAMPQSLSIVQDLAAPATLFGMGKDGARIQIEGSASMELKRSWLLAGEMMANGGFCAFDVLEYGGENIRSWPLSERLKMLDAISQNRSAMVSCVQMARPTTNGGEFLSRILAAGGEGIVRKRLAAPWGEPMEACKRLETWQCVVTALNPGKQSVRIALTSAPDQDCGNVALFGGKIDRVRVGSILKVEGFGLTRVGKIREPRVCKDSADSWLVKY